MIRQVAAVSEAKHVVGWPEQAIRDDLRLQDAPLPLDPLPAQPGLQPWEPWPEDLAARLFLETLTALQCEVADIADDWVIVVAGYPKPLVQSTGGARWFAPTYVLVEGGCETVEGKWSRASAIRTAPGISTACSRSAPTRATSCASMGGTA